MPAFFSRGKSIWNFATRKDDSDEDYNVSKLRSLYATLLTLITPTEEEKLAFRAAMVENHFSEGNGNGNGNGPDERNYTVRHFRRSNDKPGMDDIYEDADNEEEISFERFECSSSQVTELTWRELAATKINIKKKAVGDTYSFDCSFDDDKSEDAVLSLIQARKIEARVIELIRSVGEIVIYGEQRNSNISGRRMKSTTRKKLKSNEAVFEYFCDKNMLSLLVDIVKAKAPVHIHDQNKMQYNGVVWTALVKAQVLQTISILITNVSDTTSLYYLLSNNYINEVVASIIPLQQWTNNAIDEILPVYISFLKSLALKLSKSPNLFQFLCDQNGSSSSLPSFPLFYAAVEVVSSPLNVAQADSFVHTTALNIILNICQITVEDIRLVIAESYIEQRMLLSHLCDSIVERYEAIAEIMVGSRVAILRNGLLAAESSRLQDCLHFINDLLWCSQRIVNFRFCEYVMQYAIYRPILESLKEVIGISDQRVPNDNDGNLMDLDQCSEKEAKYEAALFVLSQIFTTMDYTPLLKMVVVALLHPFTPSDQHLDKMFHDDNKEFVMTPSLNAIAQNNFIVVKDADEDDSDGQFFNGVMEDESTTHDVIDPIERQSNEGSDICITAVPNVHRTAILELLSGKHGDRGFVPASLLFEDVLQCEALDFAILKMLRLVPSYDHNDHTNDSSTGHSVEQAIAQYFVTMKNKSSSKVGMYSAECAVSLVLHYVPHLMNAITEKGSARDLVQERINQSPIFAGIKKGKSFFASDCQRLKILEGVCELFTDMVELEIARMYSIVDTGGQNVTFCCNLASLSSHMKSQRAVETMVQKTRSTNSNEIEDARYAIRLFLYLSSLDDIFSGLRGMLKGALVLCHSSQWKEALRNLGTKWPASEELVAIACLDKQSIVGTDVNVGDKSHYYFSPSLAIADGRRNLLNLSSFAKGALMTEKDKRRQLADKILIKASSKTVLILVIDATELLVLKPKSKDDMEKGTILCCTLLNNVIAVAADGEWLHIAMRNVGDVGVLIKKGNMALRFENVATCANARERVEKARKLSTCDLSAKIDLMLNQASN